ncbi:hypothetical protein [Sphingomonas glaciei]|uniref:Uncharacterized protein n=1 Tax=Sphingomonas glaciei TaxID=2938948 RepID=A0ABY5MXR5_9SPHN|nr:hypothetical protein [Sphingomonas glaciei]UUR09249.1 hypothetical protein M1K48_06470 [Sphingomonas glaciei]
MALLLALFYGVLTGGAFAPMPVQAQPHAASMVRDGHAILAATAKGGKVALKGQRATPGPALLPSNPAPVVLLVVRPSGEATAAVQAVAAARGASPYRARAPPAA